MSGKMAPDGTRELMAVAGTISGDELALAPLVIHKGAAHYMGWYQHLDSLIDTCKSWKLSGWNNSFLSIVWLKNYDHITKECFVLQQQY